MEDFLNRYSSGTFERTLVSPQSSSFGETVGATVGLRLAPIYETVGISSYYNLTPIDPDFNWRENLGNYTQYAPTLSGARNAEHMGALKAMVDRSHERRFVLANASVGTNIAAGLFDPINAVTLPLGGPATSFLRTAGKSALAVGATEAGFSALSLALDPVMTIEEATLNTGVNALFGGAFGGSAYAISAPFVKQRAVTLERTQEVNREMLNMSRRLQDLEGLTPEQIQNRPARSERVLGGVEEPELRSRIRQIDAEANAQKESGNEQAAIDLRNESIPIRNELGFRQMDDLGEDVTTPEGGFNYKASWFTDSVFFNMIPTPMKRIYQGDYSDDVKEVFAIAFNDNGMTHAMNSAGTPTPQSVYVRSAVHQGRWVKANDELTRAWASETNASPASRLDINLSNAARTATRSDDTFRKWLTRVSEKRIQGDEANMTEGELKAVSTINKYFGDSEVRLEDVGLLSSRKGIEQQVEMLNKEIADLNSSLDNIRKTSDEADLVQGRVRTLENRRNGLSTMKDQFDDDIARDSFFPRFFNAKAIRQRREEFSTILYDWYTKNPYKYEVNSRGETVKVELSTKPEKIQERVDQTIDNILGESDPLNLDNISFGAGRSKHFRSRELNIPNRLVMDFMMTDPLAVMKTYAARVEPRYEFAKQFGTDVEGVRFKLRRSLMRDGKSQKEINKVMRDFNHMYDRTIGTVLENPDSLSQKVATVLREAASFSYMGSSGIAAIPDFGRIVMEYEMDNVWKGVQALVDKERLNMTVDEVRLAGEAIDILKGSAHMRLMEDMSNNIDASDALSQTRNAFYILNGLAPLTTLAKQLAGVVDAHQIIDYSIRLGKGQLDDQSTEWLARYGIGKETAALIAKAPYEKTENGFYMANTEAWTSDEFLNSIVDKTFKYRHPTTRYSEMTDRQLTTYFSKQFPEARIFTDPNIVKPYFSKLQENHGYQSLLGFMTDMRDIPDGGFSVHIDKDMVRARYERIKQNGENADQVRSDAEQAFADGKIQEEYLYHVKNELDAIDMFETADDYLEYVMLHELMHSVVNRVVGESTASVENRIDQAAIAYMRDQRGSGKNLAREEAMASLRAEQEEAVMQFRAALNSGVLNTIMSGTPADKPIITDGVVYIPMSVASKFGMTEHPKYRGYARIENGLMGLPFQFYSFALANVNKTVGALAQGQIKNRTLGAATMMGLAYMSMQIRTPDYIWDEMNARDKFARTFDMSGIMALYSDLFYTSMHTSLALGGPNITNGFLSPKFNQKGSVVDGLTGLSGAGPSWGVEMAKGVVEFSNGEYGQGGRTIVRNLPFSNMWFWKDQVNQMTYSWTQ